MQLTDKNIEITCPECEDIVAGVDNMTQHILDLHRNYSAVDAVKFAQAWAEAAYEEIENKEHNYSQYMRGK